LYSSGRERYAIKWDGSDRNEIEKNVAVGGGGGNRTSQDRTAGLMRAAVLEIDVKTFAFA